jgi:hypothetical protein
VSSPLAAPFTVVTVTFAAEMPLLTVQQRTLGRHLPVELVAEVVVLHNEARPLGPGRQRALRTAAGPLGDRLRFVERDVLVARSEDTGWWVQQVLKLKVATLVGTPAYVVLDAKNHAVRDVAELDLVGPDGRAHGGTYSYRHHPLRPYLERTLEQLDLPVEEALDDFGSTATPFVLHTAVARDLVERFRVPGSTSFEESFKASSVTEFFLYSAWLRHAGHDPAALYDGVPTEAPTVWAGSCTAEDVRRTCRAADESDAAFFAVHRRALGRMDRHARRELAAFWVRRDVFPSLAAVRWFHARFLATYLPAMALKKVGERRLHR